jgi:hypothetical protein
VATRSSCASRLRAASALISIYKARQHATESSSYVTIRIWKADLRIFVDESREHGRRGTRLVTKFWQPRWPVLFGTAVRHQNGCQTDPS